MLIPPTIPVYLTGATGYIGGSVLARLLAHPDAASLDITVTARSAEKAQILREQFKLKVEIVDHHTQRDRVAALAEAAHVVFSCADSDDLPTIQAIMRGLKDRHEKTGDVPIFIHTSGGATFMEDVRGSRPSETIYSDSDADQIEALPLTAFHRPVDTLIVDADREGYLRSYIVSPPTVWGTQTGPLVAAGVAHAHSVQMPLLIAAAIARGQSGMYGEGKAVWSDSHIDDVAALYVRIYDAAAAGAQEADVPHGREGYYFPELGEHVWVDVGRAIGRALAARGIGAEEPTPFTKEEMDAHFGSAEFANVIFGSSSRMRGDRARSIGWTPKWSTEDLLGGLDAEVEAALEKRRADGSQS